MKASILTRNRTVRNLYAVILVALMLWAVCGIECAHAHEATEGPSGQAEITVGEAEGIQPRSEFLPVLHTYWNYTCLAGQCTNVFFNPSYITITFQNGYEVTSCVPTHSVVYSSDPDKPKYDAPYQDHDCLHGGVLQMWQYTYRLF